MALVTITQAARLVNKSTQTLYRHVKAGKLSRRSDGALDTAELIRVYGELVANDITSDATGSHAVLRSVSPESDSVTADTLQSEHVKWLEKQIDDLKIEVKEIRQEGIDRENKLIALIEHRQDDSHEQTGGIFSKFFK